MTATPLQRGLTQLGVMTGQPLAFAIVGAYVAGWLLLDRASFDAHGIDTLVTWLMTLFIQRAEHRDTQAIQAKLDELLRTQGEARNELTRLDEKEAEEIEAHRKAEQENDQP